VIRRFFAFPLVRLVLIVLLFGALSTPFVLAAVGGGGHYHVVATHVTPDLAMAALLLLPGAAIEELLFRGLLFRLVEEWSGTWIALAVSAALFGLVHAANPGATWISTMAIALEAGLLVAAVRRSQVVPAAWKMSRTPQ
jgi:uncharacterized protein